MWEKITTCRLAGPLALCLSAIWWPIATSAADIDGPQYTGGHHGGSAEASLYVKGYIKPHCSISLDDKKIFKILTDGPGSAHVGFDLNCNQNLHVTLESQNGALELMDRDTLIPSPGFLDSLPYDLEFSVSVDGARTLTMNSEDIRSQPRGGDVGVIPFHARGKLKINWAPEKPLIGGKYWDVIEIRVAGEGGMSGRSR